MKSSNKIGDLGCKCLGDGIRSLVNLTALQLNFDADIYSQYIVNFIGDVGCKGLGNGIRTLINLT